MEKPGEYALSFELRETGYFNLFVVVENEHRQVVTMDVSIHSNVEALFYLKWLVLVPFLLLTTVLFFSSNLATPLPL